MVYTYEEALNGLISVMNSRRDKKTADNFKLYLSILKNDFKTEISTKYLRGLIDNKTGRQKTQKINYLLSRAGLKTKKSIRVYKEWVFNKYQTDKTEYRHKEGVIYEGFPRSFFNEEMTLINPEALNRRNAINKDGGVFVKDITPLNVGREYIANKTEDIYLIQI